LAKLSGDDPMIVITLATVAIPCSFPALTGTSTSYPQ
jgi:hypothetical protein